jgi:putative transposase
MARFSYPSDVTDAAWVILAPLLPVEKPGGRHRDVDLREIVNGVMYILRGGCAWRMMPHEFGPWSTVYDYFRKWRLSGLWEHLNALLREKVRIKAGRNATPSAAIIDSQSVKTTERGGVHGFDGHKQVNGRKRHILVDTLGLLLKVVVHSAALLDRASGHFVVQGLDQVLPTLRHLWVDAGYRRQFVEWVKANLGWTVEVVQHPSLYTYAPVNDPPAPVPMGLGGGTDIRLAWALSPAQQRL